MKMKEMKDHYLMQIYHLRKDVQNQKEDIAKLNRQICLVIEKTRKETE